MVYRTHVLVITGITFVIMWEETDNARNIQNHKTVNANNELDPQCLQYILQWGLSIQIPLPLRLLSDALPFIMIIMSELTECRECENNIP